MRQFARCFLALRFSVALTVLAPASGLAETTPLAPPQAALLGDVQFKQRLNAQLPLDAELTNDRGEQVTLADCIDGRPTIFVLAYYRCPMLCNQVLNGVARSLQAIDFESGKDFSVVVVSFDPTDTVKQAADKKKAVLGAYRKGDDGAGWHFLVGEKGTVAKLAETVGFQYQLDEATNQFAHASGIVVLTPTGKASRYFYGIEYPTRDVRLGLVEASTGKIGTLADEILLYCFHYDPLTGKYGLAIMRVIRAGGVATVAAIGCFVVVSLRRERRMRKAKELTADNADLHS
jgi:protein SCO1